MQILSEGLVDLCYLPCSLRPFNDKMFVQCVRVYVGGWSESQPNAYIHIELLVSPTQ